VAQQSPKDSQLRALEIAAEIAEVDNRISKCNIYRDQMNYTYWELRCEAEQDDLLLDARRLLYEAEKLYEETDLDGEIAKYEQAFQKWAEVYEKYPDLRTDITGDEVVDAIDRYRVATDQAELPEGFVLADFYAQRLAEAQGLASDGFDGNEEGPTGSGPLKLDVLKPYGGTPGFGGPPPLEPPPFEPADSESGN
jgi:hypothetical protein